MLTCNTDGPDVPAGQELTPTAGGKLKTITTVESLLQTHIYEIQHLLLIKKRLYTKKVCLPLKTVC